MIGNIDLLANRVLYAIYEVWVLLTRLLTWLFDWTFGCPMYSIPIYKRVAWVVGTYASIVSLIVIDIKLLSYIDKVHK